MSNMITQNGFDLFLLIHDYIPIVCAFFVARSHAKSQKLVKGFGLVVVCLLLFSWSFVILSGHGAIGMPLPSVVALFVFLLFTVEGAVAVYPSLLFSPGIAIFVYFTCYFFWRFEYANEDKPG
ncbi:hypothetical protein [Pseudoalteromonas luteoviolacea]|uniref:Uncharacterized protein n=1 Tax=Pseudoalteromonas luteoviolacea S4054 TaxID=1129367 RepID=A0A0F6AEJ6_9GAMM|nr:hypothetical protein [Pseudoalteromonas luteoviolacea]AOT10332.1 hypothetical protein S4054249_20855 [Pseudoalteromonas luteoviolacea]AOT15599.1 hypothetical protein S40542_22735 [Pseudoalteromonas luteoviolacea]AOT21057.1 hypothetical protein S4054_25695 [Pseudoalteromonas luteoviolacea]KKE84593.1 hypothetical protein N479_08490 [Pseudoalteromonas luteoviolacea S4054]KZN71262.1 hypothetical protein N481_18930 [Pseudoalteromonas luteoviolacea S4047-1]